MEQRKIYPSLDIMKFIMAMLILTQHTSNEWAHSTGLVHAFFGLGNFAVPFFFACSGFLFFKKFNALSQDEQKNYYKKWSLRIGKMYLVWSLIYFCFIFITWVEKGLCWTQPLHFLHGAIVLTTYATIWFLPALWIGVSLCLFLQKKYGVGVMFGINIILLLIGNLFGSYTNLLTKLPVLASFNEWYLDVFYSWRNGFFNASPFVLLGLVVASMTGKKLGYITNFICSIVFFILFLAEAFVISRYRLSNATDQGFMLAPAVFFILSTLVQTTIPERTLCKHLRNLSMLVFLSQRLFLSAIPSILPAYVTETIMAWSQPCIFLLFVTMTLGFSIAVEQLSDKYKFLKNLW